MGVPRSLTANYLHAFTLKDSVDFRDDPVLFLLNYLFLLSECGRKKKKKPTTYTVKEYYYYYYYCYCSGY